MSEPARDRPDEPVVAALRKKIRGEPLSAEEMSLLQSISRKPSCPPGTMFTQEQVSALLAARLAGDDVDG